MGAPKQIHLRPIEGVFAILAIKDGGAEPFRLLGPTLDEKLLTHTYIQQLYRKAKPKARALLRCRRFYSIGDLLLLFKRMFEAKIALEKVGSCDVWRSDLVQRGSRRWRILLR